ncbi:MAG: hypothetical protein ACJAQW_002107 [Paracoccaceae bacterium]
MQRGAHIRPCVRLAPYLLGQPRQHNVSATKGSRGSTLHTGPTGKRVFCAGAPVVSDFASPRQIKDALWQVEHLKTPAQVTA